MSKFNAFSYLAQKKPISHFKKETEKNAFKFKNKDAVDMVAAASFYCCASPYSFRLCSMRLKVTFVSPMEIKDYGQVITYQFSKKDIEKCKMYGGIKSFFLSSVCCAIASLFISNSFTPRHSQ